MTTVYLVCAIIGGVMLLCQLVMTLVGLGGDDAGAGDHDFGAGDHDVGAGDHDVGAGDADHHGAAAFFQLLSFRSLVAAVTFFGFAGMAATEAGFPEYPVFLVGLGAGAAAMVVVAWMMRLLYGLHDEGNVHIENTIGEVASVYLTIPGRREGPGKVTVKVQNRTMEYQAFTDGESLSTGTRVTVTGVVGPNAVEVEHTSD